MQNFYATMFSPLPLKMSRPNTIFLLFHANVMFSTPPTTTWLGYMTGMLRYCAPYKPTGLDMNYIAKACLVLINATSNGFTNFIHALLLWIFHMTIKDCALYDMSNVAPNLMQSIL